MGTVQLPTATSGSVWEHQGWEGTRRTGPRSPEKGKSQLKLHSTLAAELSPDPKLSAATFGSSTALATPPIPNPTQGTGSLSPTSFPSVLLTGGWALSLNKSWAL